VLAKIAKIKRRYPSPIIEGLDGELIFSKVIRDGFLPPD